MKSIKMIVPRILIRKHLPHPEAYGESIVELVNGMVTDVFTSEKGDLITETNDQLIIKYLKNKCIKNPNIVLSQDFIELSSVSFF